MGTVTDGRCPFDVAEIVIEVKRLTRNYAGLPAVDTVSFAIRAGEVLGYLGHNGAGKSTTVKVLLTLLTPLTLAAGAVFTWQWGAPVGITYFAFLTAATLMLIELLVVDFCKIPFTCSLPPFRNDTLAVMLGHLPGFAVFTAGGAQIASLMYRSPLRFWIFTTLVTAIWGTARYWLRESTVGATALQFTARQEAALQTLDLHDRT